jgi:hypothetical protein
MAALALRCMLAGMAIGVVTELAARRLKLWVYRQPQTPILNVIGMFGIVMGTTAALARVIGLLPACALAFVCGLAYEVANLRLLDWWYFPDERLGVIRGHTAIVVVLAVLWGTVPAMIIIAQATMPRLLVSGRTDQARLEALSVSERQLLEKLEQTRQRVRSIESKLEDVRARRQAILDRHAVRRLQPGAASP